MVMIKSKEKLNSQVFHADINLRIYKSEIYVYTVLLFMHIFINILKKFSTIQIFSKVYRIDISLLFNVSIYKTGETKVD